MAKQVHLVYVVFGVVWSFIYVTVVSFLITLPMILAGD